jgi:hypothetical protein
VGESRTARRERVILLGGGREVDDSLGWAAGTDDGCTVGQESRGQDCWWERVGLLGGREVDDLVGEVWAAGQERY